MCTGKHNRNISIFVYAAFAAFYFWMAAQIPYTHDDWSWGLDLGMQRFLHATINSRYVGNFFEVIMTRHEILKILIMGSSCFFIPYLLSSFAAKELKSNASSSRIFLFIVCNCLFLTLNHILWRQTYGWVAGFANFVISSLFLLCWIKEILVAADKSPVYQKDSFFHIICYFVISLCGQLFIENIAIYCFFLSLVFVIFYLTRYKKIPVRIISMVVGSLIGLIIVFSSSIYGELFQEGMAVGNYRKIPILCGNGIFDTLYNILRTTVLLGVRLYSLNIILNIVILLLFILHLTNSQQITEMKYHKKLLSINIALIFAFSISWIYDRICNDHSLLMYCFDLFLSGVFFLTILFQAYHFFSGKTKQMLISLWLSAPLVIAPLLVTTETGERLFFTSNIFLVLFALLLFVSLIDHIPHKKLAVIKKISICFATVLLCFYGFLYMNIGEVKQIRADMIEDALLNNEETITLPAFPYADYLHCPNPTTRSRAEQLKEFYGIPTEVTVIFEK